LGGGVDDNVKKDKCHCDDIATTIAGAQQDNKELEARQSRYR